MCLFNCEKNLNFFGKSLSKITFSYTVSTKCYAFKFLYTSKLILLSNDD